MRKVHIGGKTFKLRQSLKLRTVIGRHRLKDLAEAFCAIQLLQLCKSRLNAGTGTSGDADGDVASRNLFNSGEYYCLTACAPTNDCIHFPVSNLRAIIDDGRTFLNGAPLHTLVFTHPFAVAFVSQDPWHLEERQGKLVSPKHVVERLGTGNLLRCKQLTQLGIANTSIQ